ncbi:ArsA family ATPase [Salimicrobium salexigens]|uniref:Arsenite efflux ATP-binding protein ArsA n=1 Tax=Salimicrobium salexigens TaxID=908941 RepID=A0ABY1KTU2_9BACI|nr:ArsA family ATPase [Salimicrobium salexigens]SIS76897.1 arsenite efflux ATP-binding protein ArsA [Salimicrobium salexigens]
MKEKIVFIGGKGGVGKSTTSAALALVRAEEGKKTLIVSTDPAHNLGDIFHTKLNHEKKKLTDNLWGMEVDAHEESARYIEGVKKNLEGLVKSKMVEEVHRQIDMASASPGAEEAALFDRITAIILEENEQFDHIIFDTAPTGHTLRLLTLPEMMTVWIDGMLEKRKKTNDNYTQLLNDGEPVEDPIYDVLQERREKFEAVREIVLDEEKTNFVFVMIPERLSILETEQAIKQLHQHRFHIRDIFVNKVLPDYADGTFLQKRREVEKEHLKELRKTFRDQHLVEIPLYEEDIATLAQLKDFSDHLRHSMTDSKY